MAEGQEITVVTGIRVTYEHHCPRDLSIRQWSINHDVYESQFEEVRVIRCIRCGAEPRILDRQEIKTIITLPKETP